MGSHYRDGALTANGFGKDAPFDAKSATRLLSIFALLLAVLTLAWAAGPLPMG